MRAFHLDHDRRKRIVELFFVPLLIISLLPAYLLVSAAVLIALGRPVLYRGDRVGRHDRVFQQLKFRTMIRATTDASGRVLSDAERLTRFGRVLRKTSLDELPQFFNVLFGHMSVIGPRPLPVAYLDRYSVTQRRRHEVRPGLTGLAQTAGRNRLSWDERFELDVAYVDGASLAVDAKILFQTARIVLLGSDVSAPGHATAPEFLGAALPSGMTPAFRQASAMAVSSHASAALARSAMARQSTGGVPLVVSQQQSRSEQGRQTELVA